MCEAGVFYEVAVVTGQGDILRSGGVRGYTVQITRERFKPTTTDVFPSADPFDRLMEWKIERAEKKRIYILMKFASKTRCHRGHHLSFTCRAFSRLVFLFVEFSLSASRGLKTNNALNREGSSLSITLSLSLSFFPTSSLIHHYIRTKHFHRHHGSHKMRRKCFLKNISPKHII